MFRLNCFKIIIRLILATGQAEKGAMDFIGLTKEGIGDMMLRVIDAVEQF